MQEGKLILEGPQRENLSKERMKGEDAFSVRGTVVEYEEGGGIFLKKTISWKRGGGLGGGS